MKIIRIPHDKLDLGLPWVRTLQLKEELKQYDLVDGQDYDCHYVSHDGVIEVRFWGDKVSAASLFVLKYS